MNSTPETLEEFLARMTARIRNWRKRMMDHECWCDDGEDAGCFIEQDMDRAIQELEALSESD